MMHLFFVGSPVDNNKPDISKQQSVTEQLADINIASFTDAVLN